jgi:hypothetical protein
MQNPQVNIFFIDVEKRFMLRGNNNKDPRAFVIDFGRSKLNATKKEKNSELSIISKLPQRNVHPQSNDSNYSCDNQGGYAK